MKAKHQNFQKHFAWPSLLLGGALGFLISASDAIAQALPGNDLPQSTAESIVPNHIEAPHDIPNYTVTLGAPLAGSPVTVKPPPPLNGEGIPYCSFECNRQGTWDIIIPAGYTTCDSSYLSNLPVPCPTPRPIPRPVDGDSDDCPD